MKVKNNYFIFLLLIAAICKLIFFFCTELPIIYPDSTGYIALAKLISNFNLSGYYGVRTPGYPLIIALCNMNLTLVVVVQMLLGIMISLLTYRITYLFILSHRISFLCGLTYLFYVPQFNIERSIVNETVTTFFLTVSVYCILVYFKRSKDFYLFLISVCFACYAALTRPILIILPFWLVFLFIVEALNKKENIITISKRIIILLVLIIPILAFWPFFNYKNNHVFTISTLSGMGMTNAVGGFITIKEDKFSVIRNIYIKHRNIQMAETGSYENTIFHSIDEMQMVSGLKYVPLSMELQKMSMTAIHDHPYAFLKHILQGTWRFWYSLSDRNSTTLFSLKYLPSVLSRVYILVLNIFFLAGLPLLILFRKTRKNVSVDQMIIFVFMYLFVLGSSVAQAMVEYGTNRYFLPYQPITTCFAIIFAFFLFSSFFKVQKDSVTI